MVRKRHRAKHLALRGTRMLAILACIVCAVDFGFQAYLKAQTFQDDGYRDPLSKQTIQHGKLGENSYDNPIDDANLSQRLDLAIVMLGLAALSGENQIIHDGKFGGNSYDDPIDDADVRQRFDIAIVLVGFAVMFGISVKWSKRSLRSKRLILGSGAAMANSGR